jgi:hypothetical protein
MADYQGWKNYKTWNVAMHIGNDHGLYQMARYMAEDGLTYKRLCARFSWLSARSTWQQSGRRSLERSQSWTTRTSMR